jgi:hypothetical protein
LVLDFGNWMCIGLSSLKDNLEKYVPDSDNALGVCKITFENGKSFVGSYKLIKVNLY